MALASAFFENGIVVKAKHAESTKYKLTNGLARTFDDLLSFRVKVGTCHNLTPYKSHLNNNNPLRR